jgi:hypothetical protein
MYDLFGIVGGVLILFGFYRVSTNKWTGKSFWFEIDNMAGALLLFVYQAHHHAYVTAILNVIWVVVALRGITSYRQRRHNK